MEQQEKRQLKHFRNPFASEKCDECGTSYQAGMPACPHCTKQNPHQNRAVPFDETRMMNPGIELAVFLFGWVGLQAICQIVHIFISFVNVDDNTYLLLLNYISYALLFIGIIAISFKYLKNLFKTLFKKEILFGLVVLFAILLFDTYWAQFTSLFEVTENINQSTANTMITESPILAIIFTGLIAPFCEEMTYRCGLFTFTSRINKVVGYLATALIFACIHMHDFTSLNEWLNFPPYVFAGLAFSFAYDKWGLGASLTAHVANNVLAVLLTLFL